MHQVQPNQTTLLIEECYKPNRIQSNRLSIMSYRSHRLSETSSHDHALRFLQEEGRRNENRREVQAIDWLRCKFLKFITSSSSSTTDTPHTAPFTKLQGKGQYIPDGLTKEQYAKFAKDQADKKIKNTKKFYVGKNAETLTEWMLAEEKKGNVGKGLLSNHRLVKCKYEGWYTDESPV